MDIALNSIRKVFAPFWVLGLALPLGDTPSADQILEKCASSYDAVKTYQAMLVIASDIAGHKEKMTLTVKAECDGKGKIARSATTMTHTSTVKGLAVSSTQQQIDDGTTLFSTSQDLKQFSKRPHAADSVAGLFRSTLASAKESGGEMQVSVVTFGGKPTYKVSSTTPKGKIVILFDKQSFHLKSLLKWRKDNAGKPDLEMTVSNEKFDKPIPASTFQWSVPPGFVEVPADSPPAR